MHRYINVFLIQTLLCCAWGPAAAAGPDCSRPMTLALHDHGLLYSVETGAGIDKDFSDELIRRSRCKIRVSVMPRARIWQLIESGALDFSLSGITNEEREKFASFAWYFSNKYYLLVRNDAGVKELADFESAPALQLGVIRSFRYGDKANRFADKLDQERRVSYSTGLEPLYKILIMNRIQGMIIEPFGYPALEANKIKELTTILEFDDPSIRHGLIISKKAIAPKEREKWQALVNAMQADGTLLRIFEKYFKSDVARSMVNF
jgi:polar amino acid transport system substrate-binding protein